MSSELAIPDAVNAPIPVGWLEHQFAPAAFESSVETLDDVEGRIKAMASYLDANGQDITELEKALRVVEARRGELLPTLGQNPSYDYAGTEKRWRTIWRNWDWLWPIILAAPKRVLVTQAAVLRLITRHTPAHPNLDLPDSDDGRIALLNGDFRDRLLGLEHGSVDLIMTDPPYPKDALPLWYDLAEIASKILGPRGLLIAYTGQLWFPEVLRLVAEGGLTYGWTFALQLPGSGSRVMGRHIIQAWKPVIAFSTGTWPSGDWGDDWLISPTREKGDYEWQQNAIPARRLIERYTAPDGLVVDPFLGVGSFGVAAKQAGRRFVGVELDGERFKKAQEVIADVHPD